uniref:Complement component 1, s subcomponent n=1 Tax=Amphilophus citrinellus TaxID=61819 RepID=A0A3Q0S618_AMPCI
IIFLSLLLLLLFHSTYCMLLGWVESPGYPSGYLPYASLNWSRCAPKGHALSIRFIHLDLEDSHNCENDAVKIFSNGKLISILCGTKEFEELQTTVNPSLFSSPGGCLTLLFHSDFSNTKRHTGFRGFYSIQDFDECEDDSINRCSQFCHNFIGGYRCSCRHGYHLDKDSHTCTVSCNEDLSGLNRGDISSPSWPGSYAENANCRYTISVDSHFQVELQFSDVFDVEQDPDGQCIDALRIETPSGTLGPFCGETPPPSPFPTHASEITISFTSDGSGTNKGFSLHFTTRGAVCPAMVTSDSTVTPQKAEYNRGEIVTVTCSVGYVLNNDKGIQTMKSEFTATCQSTGTWTPSYTCELVDCGFPDIPEDGVLQLVGSDDPNTKYKNEIQFNCSSKYYTLQGDDTFICSASGEWISVHGNAELPKCLPVCGMPQQLTTGERILGGRNAKLGEIPWQLLIKAPRRGGASLINDQWAVTAAHVVDGFENSPLEVYGGLIDGRTTNTQGAHSLVGERIIIHPGYTKGHEQERTDYNNDIALVRFSSRVKLGPNLLPICLPERNSGVMENEQGTVSGWGETEKRGPSALLKYAHITAYSLKECQRTPELKPNKPMIFTDNMFCAGDTGKDSCKGDSGGPFVLPMLSGRGPYSLAGIVSWGEPCRSFQTARKNRGYYTKVENYVEWIKQTIERVEKEES